MAKRQHASRGVPPTIEQEDRILGIDPDDRLTLEELFPDERKRGYMLTIARRKVIGVFRSETQLRSPARSHHSRPSRHDLLEAGFVPDGHGGFENYEPHEGEQFEFTDHFLSDVAGGRDDLLRRIVDCMDSWSWFVTINDLPEEYRALEPYWCDKVRNEARMRLFEAIVDDLLENQKLWHHSGSRRWQASQSLVDEHRELTEAIREFNDHPSGKHRRKKHDRRPWHGRPSRDRKNGTVQGVSIGGSYH